MLQLFKFQLNFFQREKLFQYFEFSLIENIAELCNKSGNNLTLSKKLWQKSSFVFCGNNHPLRLTRMLYECFLIVLEINFVFDGFLSSVFFFVFANIF